LTKANISDRLGQKRTIVTQSGSVVLAPLSMLPPAVATETLRAKAIRLGWLRPAADTGAFDASTFDRATLSLDETGKRAAERELSDLGFNAPSRPGQGP
jgi:hypothetical protein